MKLIYENDCPTQEQALLYDIFGSFRGALYTGYRFKPNGITDNRKEWHRKVCRNTISKHTLEMMDESVKNLKDSVPVDMEELKLFE